MQWEINKHIYTITKLKGIILHPVSYCNWYDESSVIHLYFSHLKLPSSTTTYTAVGFVFDCASGSESIMAGTASRDVIEFNLDGEFTNWSRDSIIPTKWKDYRSKFISINQYDESSPIILCDNESFTLINRKCKSRNFVRKIKDGMTHRLDYDSYNDS